MDLFVLGTSLCVPIAYYYGYSRGARDNQAACVAVANEISRASVEQTRMTAEAIRDRVEENKDHEPGE